MISDYSCLKRNRGYYTVKKQAKDWWQSVDYCRNVSEIRADQPASLSIIYSGQALVFNDTSPPEKVRKGLVSVEFVV